MEIRRIRDGEGDAVGVLWDRMCREVPDGLLPGLLGRIDSLYVVTPFRGKGTSRALAEAAIAWLRERGAHTIRYLSCVDAEDDHRFWRSLGFAADMVCLSSYAD